jgi:hypothetical protein
MATMTKETALGDPTNGGKATMDLSIPYVAQVSIEGTAPFLFHRWNCEAVEAKANAAKGSKAKKTDDVDSYVYRDARGMLAVPGEYVRQSIIGGARYQQDPRSPRKSAMDLFKAGIVVLDELCSLGVKDWDYLDRRRVQVQRNGVTRVRPAMLAGWKISLALQVLTPEYIQPAALNKALSEAGRLIGVGDFRPSHGRFLVTSFSIREV